MKSFKYSSIFLVMIILFVLQSTSFAEKPLFDPGSPDSVWFEEVDYYLDGPPWLVRLKIPVFFLNDEEISAVAAPFVWSGPVILDSASFTGSRVEKVEIKIVNIDSVNNKVLIAAKIQYEYIPPGRGLLNTLYFTMSDTGYLEIDTTFIPPGYTLSFIGVTAFSWTPEFVKGLFHLIPSVSGDVNQDALIDVVDVVIFINYLFRSGPALSCPECADVNCDDDVSVSDVVYLINFLFKDGPPPVSGCF